MKIFGRIMTILAAALVVVGIALGLAKTGIIQSSMPERGGYEQRQVSGTTTTATTTPANTSTTSSDSQVSNQAFGPGGDHEREQGGNLSDIVQVFMNFIIVSLIVLPFALVPKFLNKGKTGGSQPPLDTATYA
ncbi:MAG: hypothetical protein U0350_42320 [Caldilineaceae bacterium]